MGDCGPETAVGVLRTPSVRPDDVFQRPGGSPKGKRLFFGKAGPGLLHFPGEFTVMFLRKEVLTNPNI